MGTTVLQKLERLRKVARRVTTEEMIEQGFAALEAAGLDRERVEDIARDLGLEGDDMALSVASAHVCRHVTYDSDRQNGSGVHAKLAVIDGKIDDIRRTLLEQRANRLDKEWYTIVEAAAATGFRPYTLRQCCNLGRIPEEWRDKHHRGGRWRIHRDAIEFLLRKG